MSHQPTGPEARRETRTLTGARPCARVAVAALIAVGISAVAHADPAPKRGALTPAPPLSALAIAPAGIGPASAIPPAPDLEITDGVMRRGHTLSQMLRA